MQCVQDCRGEYPCHGRPSSYKELYDTFQECCELHTWWSHDCSLSYHNAVGSPPLSGLWYVMWGNGDARCVNECDGPDENCGGKASDYKELYETFNECCEFHTWYNTDCTANVPTPGSGQFGPAYSNKYFTNFETASCLRDCEPGSSFGCAQVPSYAVLFDTVDGCCSIGQSWVDHSYCTSRSVGTYSDGWFVDYALMRCGEYLFINICSL